MKHLIISLVFFLGSFAFATLDGDARFNETLNTASNFFMEGRMDYFKISVETAIQHLNGAPDSIQKELQIESLNQLIDDAQGGLETAVYKSLKLKANNL